MRTWMIALTLVAVSALVFAGTTAAGPGCGNCGAKAHCGMATKGDCPGYDKAAMTTFEAKVVKVEKEECKGCNMTHVDLVVKTKDDEIKVRLGPAWYLDKQGEMLEKNDVVKIVASKVKAGDDDMLVAGTITKGDDVLMLRDENGLPMWRGWRRGKV